MILILFLTQVNKNLENVFLKERKIQIIKRYKSEKGSKVHLMPNKRCPTANLNHTPVNSVDKHGPYFKVSKLLKSFLGPSYLILSDSQILSDI